MGNNKKSGILMHISSLPSPYGIGTMGREAREFVDFLDEGAQGFWQVLPVCPTGYGDSPYQSFSAFAGNPYFIDPDTLREDGLIDRADYTGLFWGDLPGAVDYGALYENRYTMLRKAAKRFLSDPAPDYAAFCERNGYWLDDFAIFMALKDAHGGLPWIKWEKPLRKRDPAALYKAAAEHKEKADFWKVAQYLFFRQWDALKKYANSRGISLIGDLPIYAAYDSADVWAHPELFQLDGDGMPAEVAGCPPDGFSDDGQLWGNPLYDWEYMEKDGFKWWISRIKYQCGIYDMLRIDHFRGFDSYYAIPYGDATAKNGRWRAGPGMKLFKALRRDAGRQDILAEDLGLITDSVRELLKSAGFPGMKVMEFAFGDPRDGTNEYLPHNYPSDCVAYTGTHDNDTVRGWFDAATPDTRQYVMEYLRDMEHAAGMKDCEGTNQSVGMKGNTGTNQPAGIKEPEGIRQPADMGMGWDWQVNWRMMNALWGSEAFLTIVQAQDILGLGSEGRMNLPSVAEGNWRWRALPGAFTPKLAARLRKAMETYNRKP